MNNKIKVYENKIVKCKKKIDEINIKIKEQEKEKEREKIRMNNQIVENLIIENKALENLLEHMKGGYDTISKFYKDSLECNENKIKMITESYEFIENKFKIEKYTEEDSNKKIDIEDIINNSCLQIENDENNELLRYILTNHKQFIKCFENDFIMNSIDKYITVDKKMIDINMVGNMPYKTVIKDNLFHKYCDDMGVISNYEYWKSYNSGWDIHFYFNVDCIKSEEFTRLLKKVEDAWRKIYDGLMENLRVLKARDNK